MSYNIILSGGSLRSPKKTPFIKTAFCCSSIFNLLNCANVITLSYALHKTNKMPVEKNVDFLAGLNSNQLISWLQNGGTATHFDEKNSQ
jgi:hypothetical protein